MWYFERKAQIGKVDTFSFDEVNWLKGEAITNLTVTHDGGLVDILNTSISGTTVTAEVKGVTSGPAKLRYSIDTALRSRYIDAIVTVSPN